MNGSVLRRAAGISFGFGNQLLFLITVWFLFWYLYGDITQVSLNKHWALIDFALAVQFAFVHSWMLLPATRKRLTKLIPQAFYDSTFCLVTCLSLIVLFANWQMSPTVIWSFDGYSRLAMRACFYLSWAALFYSLYLTGLGYQTGWTPFYYWLKNVKAPRREFNPRGAYRVFRHPVYLSFLGLVWFTPDMTLDHAVLTGVWTGYIFYGSTLKDRRLVHYLGNVYREYARHVPGYPLVMFGPLGRWKQPEAVTNSSATETQLTHNGAMVSTP